MFLKFGKKINNYFEFNHIIHMSIKKDLNRYNAREEQKNALDFLKKVNKESSEIKFYLFNLPTGVGKSHLALMISDYFKTKNKNSKIDIVTATKILQDQYDKEYESIKNLKGKENYECSSYSCSCMKGKEFNRLNKTKCDYCPYDEARNEWISSSVSLTNFFLYLIYSIYNEDIMDSRESNVLIVDECHNFDEVISSFVSIKVTESTIKKLTLNNSDKIIEELKEIKTLDEYVSFLKILNKEVSETISSIDSSMLGAERTEISDKRDLKVGKLIGGKNKDVQAMETLLELSSIKSKINLFLKEFEENKDNWVLESLYNEKTKQNELSIEPIWANDYLNKYVWSRYDHVVLISGTILDKNIYCEVNGIPVNKAVYYSIPTPFDIDKRKIYYMPLGKMSWDKKEETFHNFTEFIPKILKKYEGKKGIIHTNSFDLSELIRKKIKNKRFIFHQSDNKEEMLNEHFENKKDTVIVSPSLSTGVSFDHDKARFQIIAKVPYPSLASQKNKMRKQQNPRYYSWKTCAGIMQMCGRIIRSKNDWGDTIIIDGSFGDVMRYSSSFLPNWFLSSVKRVDVLNKVR